MFSSNNKLKLKVFILLFLLFALFYNLTAGGAFADELKIIKMGIMRFENHASRASDREVEGIRDIFTRELLKAPNIAVIEREQLEYIAREQRISLSGLVDADNAITVGKLANCDYIVLGSLTGLVVDESLSEYKGDVTHEIEAKATMYARVVSTSTGEVLYSDTLSRKKSERAYSSRSKNSSSYARASESNARTRAINTTAENLARNVRNAIRRDLKAQTPEPHVIAIKGKDILINQGASLGVQAGDLYHVYGVGEAVVDTDGTVLGQDKISIAILEIKEVHDRHSSAGIYTISGGLFSGKKVGGKPELIHPDDPMSYLTKEEADKIMEKKGAFITQRAPVRDPETEALLKQLDGEVKGVNAASVKSASQKRKNVTLENNSDDPAKVIPSYGFDDKKTQNLILAHKNAWNFKNKNRKAAYDKFCEMAQSPDNDYLAAYKAGLLAPGPGEAKTWFNKALTMNPNYEPAKEAQQKLQSAPEPKKPSKTSSSNRKKAKK